MKRPSDWDESDLLALVRTEGTESSELEFKGSEALDQFKRALAMRPWAEVPPETSPRIAKTFSDARKKRALRAAEERGLRPVVQENRGEAHVVTEVHLRNGSAEASRAAPRRPRTNRQRAMRANRPAAPRERLRRLPARHRFPQC